MVCIYAALYILSIYSIDKYGIIMVSCKTYEYVFKVKRISPTPDSN